MTKTEYTSAITASQTAISTIRTDLRKLRTIEKLSKSFPDLKLVDTTILETSITEKKAEVQKLRSELSKARRIVKRMTEIEDIEAGKADTPKAKKPAAKKDGKTDTTATAKKDTEKKGGTKTPAAKKSSTKPEAKKAGQPAPTAAEVVEKPAA